MTPGYLRYALYITTPIGCRSLYELAITSDALAGSWGGLYSVTRKESRG